MRRIIKNSAQLGTTSERRKILDILEAGYQAINTGSVLHHSIKKNGNNLVVSGTVYNLKKYSSIHLISIGKCALETGKYFEDLLGSKLTGGIVLDTRKSKLKKLISYAGSHPLPSAKNIGYTRAILAYLDSLNPLTDLLIFAVSGGGSSLFCLPENIPLKKYIALTKNLHKSGATIQELNCIRKHLESVKGGKLARRIKPLKTIALYLSDVISTSDKDNLNIIASGSLVKDTTNNALAGKILKKYGLDKKYKINNDFSETPKRAGDFSHIRNHLILTNATALEAMEKKAKAIGLSPKILTGSLSCNANQAFAKMRRLAKSYPKHNIFLAGGETTVRVTGKGRGGRNQEACLSALKSIKANEIFISAASDGIDFTPYAGAIADRISLQQTLARSLNPDDYLRQNDSYNFFRKIKSFILTGKTGSNIADILLYYKI